MYKYQTLEECVTDWTAQPRDGDQSGTAAIDVKWTPIINDTHLREYGIEVRIGYAICGWAHPSVVDAQNNHTHPREYGIEVRIGYTYQSAVEIHTHLQESLCNWAHPSAEGAHNEPYPPGTEVRIGYYPCGWAYPSAVDAQMNKPTCGSVG